MASPLNSIIIKVLDEALMLADANKATILARAAVENVVLADLIEAAVDKELASVNLGPLANMFKSEIKSVIDSKKSDLIALAGSEEALMFALLESKARAYIATLQA